jgi:hypothetical protein
LKGEIKWGGKPPLDDEMMVYYDEQKEFRYVRYV